MYSIFWLSVFTAITLTLFKPLAFGEGLLDLDIVAAVMMVVVPTVLVPALLLWF